MLAEMASIATSGSVEANSVSWNSRVSASSRSQLSSAYCALACELAHCVA